MEGIHFCGIRRYGGREVEECGRTKPWTGDEASGVVPRQWFIPEPPRTDSPM